MLEQGGEWLSEALGTCCREFFLPALTSASLYFTYLLMYRHGILKLIPLPSPKPQTSEEDLSLVL